MSKGENETGKLGVEQFFLREHNFPKLCLDLKRDTRADAVYEVLTEKRHQKIATEDVILSEQDVIIDDSWGITLPKRSDRMIRVAANDLIFFLANAFNVKLSAKSTKNIKVTINASGKARRFHQIAVCENQILITAESEWGAACGLYHVQRLLKLKRFPSLGIGTVEGEPLLDPSLVCLAFKTSSTVELDYPEAYHKNYLIKIARAGYTGYHLNLSFEAFCQSEIFPELNNSKAEGNVKKIKRILEISRDLSLDVYLSLYSHPLPENHRLFKRNAKLCGSEIINTDRLRVLCSSNPFTVNFYREQAIGLFSKVPGLAGLILIVGCEGLLHCYTAPVYRKGNNTDCPSCGKLNPEKTVADLVNSIADGVKKINKNAIVAIWPYGAFTWAGKQDALAFVSNLSDNCALMTNFDTDDNFELENVKGMYFDYSISCIGPSSVFTKQSQTAYRKGLKVLAKTENGSPLEFYSVPSVPCNTRWAKKYENITKSGASGAMFNWQFIGYTESISAELAGWFSWKTNLKPEELLLKIAARDFGGKNANNVLSAWRYFDKAMDFHPFSNRTAGYFKGPFYIGFTQPLLIDPLNTNGLAPEFWITFSHSVIKECRKPLFVADLSWTQPFGAEACCNALKKMEKLWSRGCSALEMMQSENKYEGKKIIEHRALAEGILCMLRTALNMIEFFSVRDCFFRESSNVTIARKRLTKLRDIAKCELKNTMNGLECMKKNRLLGFDYIYHYAFTEKMCLNKIEHTKKLIEFDIPYRMFQYTFSMHEKDEWIYDDKNRRR